MDSGQPFVVMPSVCLTSLTLKRYQNQVLWTLQTNYGKSADQYKLYKDIE